MTTLLQDLKFGIRMSMRTPVVSGVAILSLALGIAATAATFALANGFLFEPYPYADQHQLVTLRTLRQDEPVEFALNVSVPNYRDYIAGSESLGNAALYTVEPQNLTGMDVPELLSVVVATPTLFELLGVEPSLGRGFRAAEGADGSGRVLVLHHEFWQRRFLGDRDVLGRSVLLDGEPHTVVGVMPDGFDLIPADIQVIRPSAFDGAIEDRANRGHIAWARLRPGATVAQAQLELDAVARRLAARFPEANRGLDVVVQPLRDAFPGPTDAQLVRILAAVTLFGLLIACANIANLLLGRAEERQKEVAIRTALGASRRRVVRQMLTESLLMASVAVGLGMMLAVWMVSGLRRSLPAAFPEVMLPALKPEVVAATLAAAGLAALTFGLAPALHSVSGDLRAGLGEGNRATTAGRVRKRLRNAFVSGEVAFALALLATCGVLIQAFGEITDGDPGFDPDGLLTFSLTAAPDRYPADADAADFQRELLRVLGELPGVEGVAVMSSLPRDRFNPRQPYSIDEAPTLDPLDRPDAGFQSVNPAYFSTLDIPVVAGRVLEGTDRVDGAPVVVVSEAFVAREFPAGDVLGRTVTVRGESRQIVGVVGDILQDYVEIAGWAGEMIYAPLDQVPLRNPSFAVRTSGDAAAAAADVRRAIWSVDADQPIARLGTFEAHVDETLAALRGIELFLLAMGVIALALATMGIYGVMSYSVTQQRREIGIRMTLGAERGSVVGMISRSGLRLVTIGLVLGLPIALVLSRVSRGMLGVLNAEPGSEYAFVLSASLVGVAGLATVLPALRASSVAPLTALKE